MINIFFMRNWKENTNTVKQEHAVENINFIKIIQMVDINNTFAIFIKKKHKCNSEYND